MDPDELDPEEEGMEEEDTPTPPQEVEIKPASLMEKMLKTRTILLFGGIDQKMAHRVTEQLLMLAADSDDDIKLFINSQGGHVESGDTIFDMIRYVKPKVKIIGTGWVASAGALIYVSVPREDRYCLPNTRFMIHQPAGGVRGQAADIAIEAGEILKMRQRLDQIFADQTGQSIERVRKDTNRNYWMSATEAKEYGLVGHIVHSQADL